MTNTEETGRRHLKQLARGKTDRWRRFWRAERAVAEMVLYHPARLCRFVTSTAILLIFLLNLFLVILRQTPWAGSWSGLTYELTELLMSIGVVWACAFTWYQGKHLRIGFVREKCGDRARAVLDAFAAALFMVWFAATAAAMWLMYLDHSWRQSTTVIFKIPLNPFMFLFFILATHFTVVALRSLIGTSLRAARPSEAEGETSVELEEWKVGRILW